MKHLYLFFCLFVCITINAQERDFKPDSIYMRNNYDLAEYRIPMRDGAKLYTVVYTPKDKTKKFPFLINRTCYSVARYTDFKTFGHPSKYLVEDGYIFVFQDVRGRYQSEGEFTNMTPNIPGNNPKNKKDIDESSDTYDTIEWLLKNVKGNNGKAGIFGISYPGFYSAAALPDAHPALKAVSPQAPISDFFFDDFHHNGAYLESYTATFPVFGIKSNGPTKENWFAKDIAQFFSTPIPDSYLFYMNLGPLKNVTKKYYPDNFFWKETIEHPNYDAFWQKRSILPHLKDIKPAVLTVGGWFDAEDLYGPLNIYKRIESTTPKNNSTLVMGPWLHGGWARSVGTLTHNHIYFGENISDNFLKDVESKFFAYYLKDGANPKLPEAYMYDTGLKEWKNFDVWPPKADNVKLYLGAKEALSVNKPLDNKTVFEYTSDPAKPVPYTSQIEAIQFSPRNFMSDDQRYASRRPDVLTFETSVLTEDYTLAGEILAKLDVSMTGTDADFVVKIIDVYPDDTPNYSGNPKNIIMGGYQQLVRSEVFRGRFRNSFEKPEPFVPNQVTRVNVPLQDLLHTFKKGHKIMVQIHSTWFPYIDRNPQKYVDNIFEANEEDFIKSTIRIYGSSVIEVGKR
ncbi:CocE/NonD family hydrolase [Flavobacterium sp. RHBU_3]|uniref:CocE/NonD family hydrolase n=1 Tax=Flavobacterium sp. RHBU_3 TaxID=3391184 RepID=UPI003984FCD9